MQKTAYLLFVYFIISLTNNNFSTQLFAKSAANNEKNVLVLHSYHQGLEWTDSITSGIQSIFGKRQDVNVVFEYLDTKRNYNEEYEIALQSLYRVKAKQMPFKAIITSDNAAFEFIKEYGNEFYPNVPVVYCGVNNLNPNILKDYPNFWGTGEKADHFGTLSAIKSIFPERKNLLIINDNTLTGKAIKAEIENILENFKNDFNHEIISDFTLKSLQERVENLDTSYVIYLLVINRDKNGTFISYRNGINNLREACGVPIFGSWDFYLNKGLFGGSITSGSKQGKYAANLALRIVDNTFSDDIPQYEIIESDYYFDYKEMLGFDINENQLPVDSIILNQPNENNLILRISIITVIVLTVLVFILLIWLKLKQNRAKILQSLVKEKTHKINETNQELEKVIQNKDKFFSILAHDLRGSIGVILNLSTFINNKDYVIDEEQKEEFNKDIFHVVTRTSGLLEDLFYWGVNQSKEGPTIEKTSFEINEVLRDTCNTFKINLSNVNFKTNLNGELSLNTDKNVFKFIIRNILQNAIKFSHEYGIVSVSSFVKNNKTHISIKDKGIGMSQEVIDSIYKKNPIRKEGLSGQKTTGMGLNTVLDYLKIINAKLEINSKENHGSNFTIIFSEI